MVDQYQTYQKLMASLRSDFLEEIEERCNVYERLLIIIKNTPQNHEAFDELLRHVHSFKGSSGVHGISILSALCHQFEDMLLKSKAQESLDKGFVNWAFKVIDMMRQVQKREQESNPQYADIEQEMIFLRSVHLKARKSILVIESSKMMAKLCGHVLQSKSVDISMVTDGLVGLQRLLHEPFDIAIVAQELNTLNGEALVSALRKSMSFNAHIPILIITNKNEPLSQDMYAEIIIERDDKLSERLPFEVEKIIWG